MFGTDQNCKKRKGGKRSAPLILMAVLILAAVLAGCTSSGDAQTSADAGGADEDLVIQISDISGKATFYPVEIDGTQLEILAVTAPDGTVRTAFNTCQVCYDSGRGYYKQDGDVLVCQNCGNRFRTDQIEVVSGGCNPVPILPDNKTVTEETITISHNFLNEAKVIFSNWKTEY
ncbi:MAG: DUF2318 domain-containing protein [Clostridiales Family XIII bacterium]|nr:DUF2318 domain-containing protein [Clostridiales Family XIII bacterium]